jgi:hypothetical protein
MTWRTAICTYFQCRGVATKPMEGSNGGPNLLICSQECATKKDRQTNRNEKEIKEEAKREGVKLQCKLKGK